ncbi:MAG: hypothetical protein L0Y67_08595 [Gammaproteobacteria bacterium]|nr:hypothetical protein [Gammaproteobacteria bacterium]MCI0591631.1 hypothetical protein [Gammaproteobacteria bacterium]
MKTLFRETAFKDKAARDKAMREAHRAHGYTLSEIGRALDLHYATISKVVNQRGA